MIAIDAGAEDLEKDEDTFEIITGPTDLMKVRDELEAGGFEIRKAEMSFLPKNTVEITDVEQARKVLNLAEALDDEEDVANVYSNFDIPAEILEELA